MGIIEWGQHGEGYREWAKGNLQGGLRVIILARGRNRVGLTWRARAREC